MELKNIYVLYTKSGGGHLSTAKAIKQYLEQNTSYRVTLLNPYQEICPHLDLFRYLTGRDCEVMYNSIVAKKKPLIALLFFLFFAKLNIKLVSSRGTKLIATYWKKNKPDMIISVMPWVNDIISKSIRLASLNIPFTTIITDFSEFDQSQWITAKNQFLVCGTNKLVEQAKQKNHPPERIFSLPGLIVSSSFYQEINMNKKEELTRLGLDPAIPVGLIMYGKYGSKLLPSILRQMQKAHYPFQLIILCGNTSVAEKLKKIPTPYKKLTIGYSDEIPKLMSLADFFIGKPGALSVSEALVKKLPLILELNKDTMIQEKYNAEWVIENKVGMVYHTVKELPDKVKYLLDNRLSFSSAFDRLGQREAVMQLPQILNEIFLKENYALF